MVVRPDDLDHRLAAAQLLWLGALRGNRGDGLPRGKLRRLCRLPRGERGGSSGEEVDAALALLRGHRGDLQRQPVLLDRGAPPQHRRPHRAVACPARASLLINAGAAIAWQRNPDASKHM